METQQVKSLIRHALTAIGTLLVLTGLNRFLPLVEYLTENIDSTFQAIEVLVGVVVAVFGFLRNKDRFKEIATEEAAEAQQ